MAPKTKQSDWLKCQIDFEAGNYKSIGELAERYGINKNTLSTRIFNEKWHEKVKMQLNRIESKVEAKKENMVTEYLLSSFSRAKKYEKIIDASLSQCATDTEGNPVVDPAQLDAYTRSELRIHDLAKSALRIPAVSQVDLTSKGQSIGQSLVSAIEKLRESGKAIDITVEQVAALADYEVVPDVKQ